MILIFEQDTRSHGQRGETGRFQWRACFFRGRWRGRTTWRLGWGMWSLSYYPEPGISDFFEWVELGQTHWYGDEGRPRRPNGVALEARTPRENETVRDGRLE